MDIGLSRARWDLVKDRPADDAERLFVANNLAVTLKESADDNAGALLLMEEVLSVRRRTLGDDHPDTLDSITNLALQHNEMGDFSAALPLSLEAVSTFRRTLGADVAQSAEALVSISCLGAVYNSLRDYNAARPLLEESFAARLALLGEGHLESMNVTHLLGACVFGQGEHEKGLELLERAAAQARRVLGDTHPSTRHFAASLDDARARSRGSNTLAVVAAHGAASSGVGGAAASESSAASVEGRTSAAVDALLAVLNTGVETARLGLPSASASLDDLLDQYIALKRAMDACSACGVSAEGDESQREVCTRAAARLERIIEAIDAAQLANELEATRIGGNNRGGRGSGGSSSGGGAGGSNKGRKKGGKKKKHADMDDWEADAVIIDAEPLQQPQQQERSHEDEASTATGSAAARVAALAKAKLERDDAAGGFTSLRGAYDALGADGYYEAHGAEYTNPHEPTITTALPMALEQWRELIFADGPLRRGLDLGCGSGEATAAFERWEGAAGCDVTAADPYTYAAFERRMGRPAERWTFADVAAGVLDERQPFDICLSSFALHLIEPSYLFTTLAALARSARLLVVLTPHKRPVIEPSTGWRSAGEVVHERVRVRLYVADGARRPEESSEQEG